MQAELSLRRLPAERLLQPDGRTRARQAFSACMAGLATACAASGVLVLLVILSYIAIQGAPALNPAFFTERPLPFGEVGGGVAPAVIVVPSVTRTVEEMLRLVPNALREASYALGVPVWKTVLAVVLPAARGGIITGVVLALARAGGETAPLLLTALGNQFF